MIGFCPDSDFDFSDEVDTIDTVVAEPPAGWPLRWDVEPDTGGDLVVRVLWFTAADDPRVSRLLADEHFDSYDFRLADGEEPDEATLAALSSDMHRRDLGRACQYRDIDRAFDRVAATVIRLESERDARDAARTEQLARGEQLRMLAGGAR